MVIAPLNNKILLEPINVDESWSKDLKDRTSLLSPLSQYIGVPKEGIVKYSAVEGIEPGLHVVFDEPRPKGFWFKGGRYIVVREKDLRGVIR